jgi:hypothetical protein
VIVRIATEGQYEVPSAEAGALQELDREALASCDSGDERRFEESFRRLLDFVRAHGQLVPAERLAPSDLILPPADTSLADARAEFSGEGLIPGS